MVLRVPRRPSGTTRAPSSILPFPATPSSPLVLILLLLNLFSAPLSLARINTGFEGIPGDFCRIRQPRNCCQDRIDECSMPVEDTKCYCDEFCDRHEPVGDCCPDYEEVCRGVTYPPSTTPRPTQPPWTPRPITGSCEFAGASYPAGQRAKLNCNWCTCSSSGWQCETDHPCMIQQDLLEKVQGGGYTWQASNYTDFWGHTLEHGVKFRLGTLFPERSVENMNELLIDVVDLPHDFDARSKWPGKIQEVRDQGDCGSSWAFSTTALSADRLAIQSDGKLTLNSGLSAQQLLSCNQHRQRGCDGGYLDRAWWFIRKFGAVSTECYPYDSGNTNDPGVCQTPKATYEEHNVECPSGSADSKVYKMTPPYRVSDIEQEIQTEIITNGPVQATFKVNEDFYMYKSGVYQYTDMAKSPDHKMSDFHSVRILGWGEEGGVKYWLCANSWGPAWGENGLFKIARGTNHCQVEAFVIGAWGKGSKKKRHRFKVRRFKKFRNFAKTQ